MKVMHVIRHVMKMHVQTNKKCHNWEVRPSVSPVGTSRDNGPFGVWDVYRLNPLALADHCFCKVYQPKM